MAQCRIIHMRKFGPRPVNATYTETGVGHEGVGVYRDHRGAKAASAWTTSQVVAGGLKSPQPLWVLPDETRNPPPVRQGPARQQAPVNLGGVAGRDYRSVDGRASGGGASGRG